MTYVVWLVPIALGMGVVGLVAFLWTMRSGQYDDLDGAAERVLLADAFDRPLRQPEWAPGAEPDAIHTPRNQPPSDDACKSETSLRSGT